MQYYSPFNGYTNGETNFSYVPTPPACAHPQIMGEGDVTSVTLPDGTLQLYFVPAPRSYLGSYLPWGAVPAWFIRTIPNLSASPHPFTTNHRGNEQSSNTYLFPNNFEESEEKLKYQLQFHNDRTTSSTDMHYFSQPYTPNVHPCRYYSRQSVETQVDQPVKYYGGCCKACRCNVCRPHVQERGSEMSIDRAMDEDNKTHNKVRFISDTSTNMFCDNCKNKCNDAMECTSEKAN